MSSVKMPSLPDSAGAFRSWKNAFLPMVIALDSSDQSYLYQWLTKAFNAKTPAEVQQLKLDSEGFPRFDRVLCSWCTRESCLKGHFGTRIQAFIEESMSHGYHLRGRPLLNMIIREFDLDAALGGMLSAVELFQIPSPDSDIQSLIHFRDKIRYILGQLSLGDRSTDVAMSKWLFERLKKVRPLQMTIDRIKESALGSVERSYDFLWTRLGRFIAESQQEKNLASVQEGLKKGPKKPPTPATPANAQTKGKAKGGKTNAADGKNAKGKGTGGIGGKSPGKQKGQKGSPNAKDGPKGANNSSNVQKKDGVCLFYPKGLCRRVDQCPYRHEDSNTGGSSSSQAKPKAAPASTTSPAPRATVTKAAVAFVAASHTLGASANVMNSCSPDHSFHVEWALDSGAGEDLASLSAFSAQGIPESWISEYVVESCSPLTFDTGGGAKAATHTVGFDGDKAGSGMVYMLKSCPYVRSLGKLVEKGFSFFWGPDHFPALVPPEIPFEVSCDESRCFRADRVEHCVPIFQETISLKHGMPASSHSQSVYEGDGYPSACPAPSADANPGEVEGNDASRHDIPESNAELPQEVIPIPEGPIGVESHGSKDRVPPEFPDELVDDPKEDSTISKIPVDHLLTHQPASKHCDVRRRAKLRTRPHRRFVNQSASLKDATEPLKAPKHFWRGLQLIILNPQKKVQRVNCMH